MVRGRRVVEDTVDGLVVSNHVPQAGFCKRKRSPSGVSSLLTLYGP